jgi:PBSX family phage terminase large subunit
MRISPDRLDTLFSSFSRKQILSVARADARINVWDGAIRSGKTVASLLRWLMFVADAPPGELAIIGKTRTTVARNVIAPLQDRAVFGDLSAQVKYTTGADSATILGRRVWIIGAADAKAESKIRGLTLVGVYVDEGTLLPNVEFFSQLLGRMSVPGAQLFLTTNPDNPAHWLRRDYLLRAGEPGMSLRHWHFTLDDNPSLTDEFVAAIKAENIGLWYKRRVLGLWAAAEGAIYDMWDAGRHVVDIMPPISHWIAAGIDHGTKNPFAALALGLGVNRKLYLASEWRYDSRQAHRQLTDVEYSRKVREWLAQVPIPATQIKGIRPSYIVVDPAAAGFRAQLAADGMNPVLANNSVLDGIRCVSSLLGLGALMVHRSCKGLVDEIGGYSWDDRAGLLGEDKPVKVDDHSLDATRYAVFSTKSVWGTVIPLTSPAGEDAWAQSG